jgi:hypothetical protein
MDEVLCGAVCLIFGWGSATLGHECFHLAVARSLGLTATLGEVTLTTGSVFVQGAMTSVETMLVAVAGSLGWMAGYLCSPHVVLLELRDCLQHGSSSSSRFS